MENRLKKWIWGAIGFVAALACCLPFVRWDREPEPVPAEADSGKEIAKEAPIYEALSAGKLPTEPANWLSFAKRAGTASAQERQLALERVLELPEGDRRTPLTMLLLSWLESDAGAAVLWCQENLKGVEHRTVLRDLATTWAHRDAMEIAHWWAEHMPDSEVFSGGTSGITGVLARTDPLAYATYMDIPRLHKIASGGVIEINAIPSGDRLPVFAESIIGKVAYQTDNPEVLLDGTFDRHLPGKSGWNFLFETVAVVWHRDSPEACEAWLNGFSEEAQIAARHRIKLSPR